MSPNLSQSFVFSVAHEKEFCAFIVGRIDTLSCSHGEYLLCICNLSLKYTQLLWFYMLIMLLIYIQFCKMYSEDSLIQIILLSGHIFGNYLRLYIYRKRLTYMEIQLSGQSSCEWRCPDKWGSTVYDNEQDVLSICLPFTCYFVTCHICTVFKHFLWFHMIVQYFCLDILILHYTSK